jgi:ABC-type bacteriocin/lantibiotic exporter with double-glycine peptidase domain
MDEPSASLDPQTEHTLFDRLAQEARAGRSQGRITLLISHRFSTVRAADLIISPSQPFVLASATRSLRLWMMSMSRPRSLGSSRSMGQRTQASLN